MKKYLVSLLLTALFFAPSAFAQCSGAGSDSCVAATTQTITASTTVSETLTVSLSTATLTLPAAGWPTLSSPVTATVTYNVSPTTHQNAAGGLYAAVWLGSASAAITGTNGVANIPSSDFVSAITWSGTAYSNTGEGACTNSLPSVVATAVGSVAGATCGYPNPRLTPAQLTAAPNATLTDSYTFGYNTALPVTPSTYTGTIYISYVAL
jgi:hypothetical protein